MGTILMINPFNIKREKRAEFATWLKNNEEALRQAVASVGGTYRGTYLGTLGLAPSDAVNLIEYSSFEDFDAWRELDEPKINKVMSELMAFTERCGMSSQVYEQTPDAFSEVVVRKHRGKRVAK